LRSHIDNQQTALNQEAKPFIPKKMQDGRLQDTLSTDLNLNLEVTNG